jgi:hypothetical protein
VSKVRRFQKKFQREVNKEENICELKVCERTFVLAMSET